MATSTPTRRAQSAIENYAGMAHAEDEWRMADPDSRLRPNIRLNVKTKYLFRSKPGTLRSFNVRVEGLPDDFKNEAQEKVLTSRYTKRRERIDGANPPFSLDSIRNKIGGNYIEFTMVQGSDKRQGECYYGTDDDEIASYMLQQVNAKRGKWADITVEYPTQTISVNGMDIPNTAAGWDAARLAAQSAQAAPDKE